MLREIQILGQIQTRGNRYVFSVDQDHEEGRENVFKWPCCFFPVPDMRKIVLLQLSDHAVQNNTKMFPCTYIWEYFLDRGNAFLWKLYSNLPQFIQFSVILDCQDQHFSLVLPALLADHTMLEEPLTSQRPPQWKLQAWWHVHTPCHCHTYPPVSLGCTT